MRIGSFIFVSIALTISTACGGSSAEQDAEEPPQLGETEDGARVTEGEVDVQVEQVGEE